MAFDTTYKIEMSSVELRVLFQLLLNKNQECEVLISAGDDRVATKIEAVATNLIGIKAMLAMVNEEVFHDNAEWLRETIAEAEREGWILPDGTVIPITELMTNE